MTALWTAADAAAATGGSSVDGVGRDRGLDRHPQPGRGRPVRRSARPQPRRPRFCRDCAAAGCRRGNGGPGNPAASGVVAAARRRRYAGRSRRARRGGAQPQPSSDRRGYRQRRQDRDQGGVAPGARQLRPDLCLGRRAQQSLGRAAVARPLAAGRLLRRLRARHEPSRRDRGPHAARAPACCGDHDGGAGASRLLPVGRGNRRCQGRDLPRAGTRRRRGSQPRQPALRKIGCGREACRRRRDPRLWNPSGSRRAPGRLRARFARQHGRGCGLRHDYQVSGAGPGPALGHERTRGARCGAGRRRGCRSRRGGAGRASSRCRAAVGATNSLGAAAP